MRNVFSHGQQAGCDSGGQNNQRFVQRACLHAVSFESLCDLEQNLKFKFKHLTQAGEGSELMNSRQMWFHNLYLSLKTDGAGQIKCH